jgi:hypothetical protein
MNLSSGIETNAVPMLEIIIVAVAKPCPHLHFFPCKSQTTVSRREINRHSRAGAFDGCPDGNFLTTEPVD